MSIDFLSMISLIVELKFDKTVLSHATGFIVQKNSRSYLVSNRHVFSGRDSNTNSPLDPNCAIPNKIVIGHHSSTKIGNWQPLEENLVDSSGKPLWIEHSSGRSVDVAVLPIQNAPNGCAYYPLDLNLANADVGISPSQTVQIIGFPLNRTAGGLFPIWKTGHIASEPDINYGGLACFLIDATTREGMSGSPVFRKPDGSYLTRSNSMAMKSPTPIRFLGVYSGRIREGIEIGRVWKPETLTEILQRIP